MESKFTLHFLFLITFYFFLLPIRAQETSSSDCQELSVNAELSSSCAKGSNGQIKLVISQGLPPYRIRWEDGGTEVIRKVTAGTYRVQVMDALGCQGTGAFTIQEQKPISIAPQVKHTSKAGKSNGEITLDVQGGNPPYTYTWISSTQGILQAATEDIHHLRKLPAGIYQILVFDAAGCYTELETVVR